VNKKRVLPIVGALVVVVALVALALVAARGGKDELRVLPVLSPASSSKVAGGAAEDTDLTIAGYNEYVLPDELPDMPDEAPAYDLSGDVDEDDVRELARLLGNDGDVVESEWGWTVDGGDRVLDVQSGAGGSWSAYAVTDEDVPVEVTGDEEPVAPSASIDRELAEEQGRAMLSKLGVDLDGAAVRVEDGWSSWIVTADPEVGGLPTIGFSTSVSVGPEGRIEFANGYLAPAEVIGDYPLEGAREAVARANALEEAWAEEVSGDHPIERWTFEVQRVRLGLSLSSTYETGSPAYLVPSYLLQTEDGWEASFVAVADELLAEAPTPTTVEPDEHDDDHADEAVCVGQAAGAAPGEVPEVEELQLCGPATAQVGETVTFEVTAEGKVRDDCASPLVGWGDGSEQPVCEIGCVALPTETSEVVRQVEHVYDEPGTYTVEAVLAGCPGGEQGRISTQIVVEG
jgi:hypothetical protein